MENEESIKISKNIKSTVKYFSSKNVINGAYIKDRFIYYYDEKVVSLDDIRLKGMHNYENIMCAIMATKEFGIKNDSIVTVLKNFNGVEHRLEFVREVNGVKYYNDTEATNIKCTQIALKSFDEKTILILGGYERGQDFNELKDFTKNVKAIVAIGQCRARVKEFGDSMNIPTYEYERLSEGFEKCVDLADENDVVLLSPASASWDQYKQCEDRGAEFKELVNKL